MSDPTIPVAVALLVKNGSVLMGERRPDKVYPLHWEFPGGKLEEGETALQAVRRELHEELAIEVLDAEEWFSEVAEYSHGTYAIIFFVVRDWSGEIVNRDFNRVAWLSQAELPLLKHLAGNERILARI